MRDFEQVLMNRDGLTSQEAKSERNEAKARFYEILEEGGDYGDVEDMLLDEYGLEMDYILDLI